MTATADATDSSTVTTLVQAVKDLQEAVERQADRINELETELAEHKDHTGREFADVRGRITDVENQQTEVRSAGATLGGDADEPQSQTPLERICNLPHDVADRELTANQERARFIARDVRDYAEKAPAGLVIDSRAIKRVITASEGKRPHTQTVARVMNFLDELGKEDVQLKKRRGKKFVVVDPDTADADEDAQNSSLSVLAHQHPETGGTPEHEAGENADDPEGVEALSAETRSEVKDKLERAETFGHRLPEHCENLRQEAVDLVPGAETVADIDLDEL